MHQILEIEREKIELEKKQKKLIESWAVNTEKMSEEVFNEEIIENLKKKKKNDLIWFILF